MKARREISYYHPETNIAFAEDRMKDFVAEWSWRQQFSAALPRGRDVHLTPTLFDLAVSAYLQGIEDTVQVSTARGWLMPPRNIETEALRLSGGRTEWGGDS